MLILTPLRTLYQGAKITIINGKCVRILDVNGNGSVDYLQCDAAGQCKAWINTGFHFWQIFITYLFLQ
jgi:hypothetical protein